MDILKPEQAIRLFREMNSIRRSHFIACSTSGLNWLTVWRTLLIATSICLATVYTPVSYRRHLYSFVTEELYSGAAKCFFIDLNITASVTERFDARQMDKWTFGPQSQSKGWGENRALSPLSGTKPRFLDRPARCVATILTEIPRPLEMLTPKINNKIIFRCKPISE
jgi:hypothetical protein